MIKKTLCSLTAIALLSVCVPFGSPLAQDSEDIFSQFREEAPQKAEVVPDAPKNESLNPLDAYRNSVEEQQEEDIFGQADNEIFGQESTPEDLEAEIREEAFNAAVNGFLPIRPDEIRRFLEIYDEVKQASNTPVYPYPRPENKVQEISLDPADPPEVIKLATGHVTHLAFYDITGERWPINAYTFAGDFELNPPDEGGSSIRIIPMSDFAYGNIVVQLSKFKTPIIFTLQAQREIAHARYEAIIPELGPFAKPGLIAGNGPKTTAGSYQVVSVLDGTPPESAKLMDVTGADSRTKAYDLEGSVYLRTPHTLISPAWSQSATSGDGMNVYVLKKTPVVLLSEKGKIIRTFINDKENDL